jgi:addiction module HigA family antidote
VSISNNTTEGRGAPHLAPENVTMAEYEAGPRQRPPTHPGRVLASALEAAGLNASSAAPLIGTTKVTLGRIMAQDAPAPVSTDMALRLGKFFGNGPELWAGLQTDYDIWQASHRLAEDLARIKTLPRE